LSTSLRPQELPVGGDVLLSLILFYF
jgi:hypothetical protein